MKKFFLIIILLALATILGISGAYVFWWKKEADGLRRLRAEIRAGELPTTKADFFPEALSDDENAGPLLKKVAGLIVELPKDSPALRCTPGNSRSEKNTSKLPPAEVAALQAFLAEPATQEIIALLREAAGKDACHFDRDLDNGLVIDQPDAGRMISASRLLANDAWFSAQAGDTRAAVDSILAIWKLAGFYENDPLVISWLVGAGCTNLGGIAAMDLVATQSLTADELDRLEAGIKAQRKRVRASLIRAIDGERVFFGDRIFKKLVSSSSSAKDLSVMIFGHSNDANQSINTLFQVYRYPLRPLLLADHAAYLKFMIEMRQALLDPQSAKGAVKAASGAIPPKALLTRLIVPTFEGLVKRLQETEVSLDLAQLGLQAEKFRLANGRYPATLDEIPWDGARPTDPFNGRELHFQAGNDSVLIYSVGADGIDNEGRTKKVRKEADIAWSVQRP